MSLLSNKMIELRNELIASNPIEHLISKLRGYIIQQENVAMDFEIIGVNPIFVHKKIKEYEEIIRQLKDIKSKLDKAEKMFYQIFEARINAEQ